MDIFYIDYPNLDEEGYKRVLFLERIFRILKFKESIKYDQLDLSSEDLNSFINLISSQTFEQYISIFNSEINLKNNIDGQVLIGINKLIEDLNPLIKKIEEKNGINELIEQLNENTPIGNKDLNLYLKTLAPLLFQKWLFKYITISFIPHSREGLKIYKKSLFELSKSNVYKTINWNFIVKEVKLLNKRKENGEINDDDIDKIKYFLLDITKHIEYLFKDNRYGHYLTMKILDLFEGIKLKEDKFKENKINSNKLDPDLKEDIALFLVKKGNDKRNPYISTYEGKVALFNNSMLFKIRLRANQVIVCKILANKRTFVILNPLKRLINKKDALNYIKDGIKCEPSKEEIVKHLEG